MPRDYYLLPGREVRRASARPTAPISSRCQDSPASPTPAPRPTRSSRSRPRWPRSNGRPSRAATSPSSTIPMTLAGLKAKAPEFDWALMLKTAGLDASPTVLMAQQHRADRDGQDLVATPLADVEGLSRLPLRQRPRDRSCPRRSTTRSSISIRRRCRACRCSATAGSAASQLVNGALGEAVGAALCRSTISRRRAEAQDGRADRQSARRLSASDRRARPGWTTRRARRRWPSSPRSIRASAIRSSISTIRRFKVDRGDLLGNAMRVGRVPASAAAVSASPSRSTARCGR